MFKSRHSAPKQHLPTLSQSRPVWTWLVVMAIVILVPLAVEGSMYCYAAWREVLGESTEVHTPTIDTISEGLQSCNEWYRDQIGPSVHYTLREPKLALPLSLALIVVAIAFLKR